MTVDFLHVRKTGGTAIAEAVRPVAETFGIVLHDHRIKLCDIPRDHRVVFFVRHPIPRFVSGFYSRLRCGLPRHHYPWNEAEVQAFRFFRKANALAEALSAPDREVVGRAHDAMRGISHVKNTYRDWFSSEQELEERLDSILMVGLQEKLSSDFHHLKALLNLPPGLSLPSDERLSHRTPADFDRTLSPLAERNLCRWYAEDIHFYERCLRLRSTRGL